MLSAKSFRDRLKRDTEPSPFHTSVLPYGRAMAFSTGAGMSNGIPLAPPDGEKMAVFRRPPELLILQVGPPEVPRSTAASIRM